MHTTTIQPGDHQPGDRVPADELLPLVYQELRRLAASRLAHETAGQTLQPTALVHEAWLRLGGDQQPAWANQAAFFSSAAEAMRRILVDRARSRKTLKRGAGAEHIPEGDVELAGQVVSDERLLALDAALEKFAAVHPRKAELVRLRYFVGLTFEEVGEVLGIAVPTAKEWWAYSRSWLRVQMRKEEV
jgi:RNA polymerase sigma factor (TIGR02999 family)